MSSNASGNTTCLSRRSETRMPHKNNRSLVRGANGVANWRSRSPAHAAGASKTLTLGREYKSTTVNQQNNKVGYYVAVSQP